MCLSRTVLASCSLQHEARRQHLGAPGASVGTRMLLPGLLCRQDLHMTPAHAVQTVTGDATAEAGSAPECATNVAATFKLVFELGVSADGRAQLSKAFSTCSSLQDGQATDLAYWLQVPAPGCILQAAAAPL